MFGGGNVKPDGVTVVGMRSRGRRHQAGDVFVGRRCSEREQWQAAAISGREPLRAPVIGVVEIGSPLEAPAFLVT